MNRVADTLTEGDLQQALRRIGIMFVPRADQVRALNEHIKIQAPLMSLIPITRYEAGHPAGIIGPQDEDADGRLVHQMANQISMDAIWIAATFDKLVARYAVTADQIVDALSTSPVFANARRSILVSGIEAVALAGLHRGGPRPDAASRTCHPHSRQPDRCTHDHARFSAGVGAGRQVGRDAPSPKTSLRGMR